MAKVANFVICTCCCCCLITKLCIRTLSQYKIGQKSSKHPLKWAHIFDQALLGWEQNKNTRESDAWVNGDCTPQHDSFPEFLGLPPLESLVSFPHSGPAPAIGPQDLHPNSPTQSQYCEILEGVSQSYWLGNKSLQEEAEWDQNQMGCALKFSKLSNI